MQISTRSEGDFTTNPSVVVQISKRQDVCLVSLNPTTPLAFACESYIETAFLFFNVCWYYDKIASAGEGHKPSSNRQKYIAESEFALLSILYKLIIIIYFPQGCSEEDEEAELINVFNCRYWQTEIAFARMLKHSPRQPCVHDCKFGEHSWESLQVMDATVLLW